MGLFRFFEIPLKTKEDPITHIGNICIVYLLFILVMFFQSLCKYFFCSRLIIICIKITKNYKFFLGIIGSLAQQRFVTAVLQVGLIYITLIIFKCGNL